MPIVEIDETGEKILIWSEFREKERIKQIPGARWDKDINLWWLPLSWAGCIQLRGVFGQDLQIGEKLSGWARIEYQTRVAPCLALKDQDDSEDLAFLSNLLPFQRAGVRFMSTAGQALLADEMGLGKTVQAIATCEVLGDEAYPVLVVSPNSMKYSWKDEFGKWAPGRKVVVINGTPKQKEAQLEEAKTADVTIINYDALRGSANSKLHMTRLAPYGSVALTDKEKTPGELNAIDWSTVIADEAHRAKDPTAKQTRALWAVGDNARRRYALTGTPVANSPEDIWTLMRFVSPAEYPFKTKFIERYGVEAWNLFGFRDVVGIKEETKDELFKFFDPRFLRRLKDTVLPQLPEKTYTTRTVEMGAKQKKAYEDMRKHMMAELQDGRVIYTYSPLTKCLRLLQFASAYGEVGDPAFDVRYDGKTIATYPTYEEAWQDCTSNGRGHVNDATPLFLTEPSCKIDALEEIVIELGGQQAVVFAESRQLIEIAVARLRKNHKELRVGEITGTVSVHERQENVRKFQAGELDVMCLTMAAGGEGITLTAAQTAIFLQRSFNAVHNLQAEDRIHRIGQEGNVTIIDLVTLGSIEERVHEARQTKAEMMEEIVRDRETLEKWLSK